MTIAKTARRPRTVARYARTYKRLRTPGGEPLRLHLGCGQKRLEGFVNVDHNPSPATDYVSDIARLPCPPASVERIETYHVIEHIPEPVVHDVLAHWLRLLRPGGVLVLECPDFAADIEELLAGYTERMYSIFGRHRFPGDAHAWGYTADSLSALLRDVGFVETKTAIPLDYHAEHEPCIRVEATA